MVEDVDQQSRELARTNRPGRPNKSMATSSHSNQVDLHLWLRHTSSTVSEGTHVSVHEDLLASLLCYGFKGSTIYYSSNLYLVDALLDDPHAGVEWYCKPYLSTAIDV